MLLVGFRLPEGEILVALPACMKRIATPQHGGE
jgi:hypothetical protein